MENVMAQTATAEVEVSLGFSRPEEVVPDHEGRAVKRAISRPIDSEFEQQFEYRQCRARDWSAPGQPALDLLSMGFEAIDLGFGAFSSENESADPDNSAPKNPSKVEGNVAANATQITITSIESARLDIKL